MSTNEYAEMICTTVEKLEELGKDSSKKEIAKYIEQEYKEKLGPNHSELLTENLKRLTENGRLSMKNRSYKRCSGGLEAPMGKEGDDEELMMMMRREDEKRRMRREEDDDDGEENDDNWEEEEEEDDDDDGDGEEDDDDDDDEDEEWRMTSERRTRSEGEDDDRDWDGEEDEEKGRTRSEGEDEDGDGDGDEVLYVRGPFFGK